jgi:hypothetical protein
MLLASSYSKAHFQRSQREVDIPLQNSHHNYKAQVQMSPCVLPDLEWWINLSTPITRPIHLELPQFYVTIDASSSGWGIVRGNKVRAGKWPARDNERHINVIELQAVLFIFSVFGETFHGVQPYRGLNG